MGVMGWPAILDTLPDQPVPSSAAAQLSAAGIDARPGSLHALPPDTLGVLWVGDDWAGGLARLSRLPTRRARGQTLLWARRLPTQSMEQVWTAGGLWAFSGDVPASVVAAAAAAIHRWDQPTRPDLLRGLAERAGLPPPSLLQRAARLLAQVLGCSRWDAVIRDASGALASLSVVPGGVEPSGRQLQVPPDAIEGALRAGAVTVLPEAGLVVVPIRHPPAPDGAIGLCWREAFLPTAHEAALLRSAAMACAVAWGRHAAEQRQGRAHVASLEALAALPWQAETRPPDGRQMLRRLLVARADLPGLVELWACASSSSREQPTWIGIAAGGAEATLSGAARAVARAAPGEAPHRLREGRWLTSHRIDNSGVLVATFETDAAAWAARPVLVRLTADLSLGLRLLRRSSDSSALIELSRVLAEITEPRPALVRVSEIIREQLSADGVAVFLMVTQGKARHLEQVLQTGERRTAPHRVAVSERQGLVDWVLQQDDWLLQPHPATSGDRVEVTTGAHGTCVLQPRPSGDYWGARSSPPPPAHTRLLVPLKRQGQVVGVLAAWRSTPDPFDVILDVETMQHLAPHVTNACVRVRGTEQIKAELASTQALAAALRPDLRPSAVRRLVLAEVCRLTGWPRAVMYLHDPRSPGQLYFAAGWSTTRADKPDAARLRQQVLDAGDESAGWPALLTAKLHRHFAPTVPVQAAPLQGRQRQHRGVVVLVGLEDGPAELPLTPQLDALVLGSFLRYAGALQENHTQAFADAVGDQIERAASGAPRTLDDALAAAARFLASATGAELIRIEQTRPGGRVPLHCVTVPPVPPGLATTERPLEETASILDAADEADPGISAVDPAQLSAVREACGWSGVRSWIGAPIRSGGRVFGSIQAMTSASGPFLGPDEIAIVEAAAAWAGGAIAAAQRRETLEELNVMAHRLAGLTGEALGKHAVEALEEWLERHLGRRCRVALLALTPPNHPLLIAHSPSLDGALIEALRALSVSWGPKSRRWPARARLSGWADPLPRAGAAVPLRLPGQPALRGHLVALHRSPFSDDDAQLLAEAARELANLLHAELIQQEWRFQIGLFRHALLGPVQGLSSAALRVAMLAREPEPDSDAEVARLERRIHEETEIIRLWRDTQRTFATLRDGTPLEVRPRPQPLRPLLERCLARYQPAFANRGIVATLDWPGTGALRFPFDRVAVDLAVSNLLDNARKYAFFNRTVTLGAQVDRDMVAVWVEDIGAEIPPGLDEAIYDLRKRTDRQDPIRAIHGEGLGLYITAAVAKAHGGELGHRCQREGSPGDNAPHRVRFTLWLPHHWRSR